MIVSRLLGHLRGLLEFLSCRDLRSTIIRHVSKRTFLTDKVDNFFVDKHSSKKTLSPCLRGYVT